MNKRNFVKSLFFLPALTPLAGLTKISRQIERKCEVSPLKISLNAYSFNGPLSKGEMDLHELFEFCADHHFDAVDPTAYYFPGYPAVPSDRYLYDLKHKAFQLGLEISGTGVRNDFTVADAGKRKADIVLVKNWIIAAEKMGAPVIRVFSGNTHPAGYSREQIAEWMVKDLQECVEFGKNHGVVVAVQNHDDFIQNSDQLKTIIQQVDSPWFGLILDTGSYGTGDPYDEIQSSLPHAVSWQIKELIKRDGTTERVDLNKLLAIIRDSNYRGYLPIETLGPGDPFQKVPVFLKQVREVLSQ